MTASRRAPSGPAPRRVTTLLLLVVGAASLVLGTPSSAAAHDGLVSTSPASGATVAVAPDAVELDFTGEPLPLGTLVAVTGPGGEVVSSGDAEIRGTTLVQAITADTSAGAYRVEWRSTSSDGHALSGSFDFTVTTGGAPGEGVAVVPAAAPAPADPQLSPVWPVAGAVVLVGFVVLLVTRLRRRA